MWRVRLHRKRGRRRAPGGFAGRTTVSCACRSLRIAPPASTARLPCNRPKASLPAGPARGPDGRPRGQTRVWRNPGKLRPHLGRRRVPSDERKPGKRRMRPGVAKKQVRTLMSLQPSTVVDDDSCEIGEVRGIARSWRGSCFRCTAGTAQVWESTLLSPGVQPLCSWRERRRLIRATTTSGETAEA